MYVSGFVMTKEDLDEMEPHAIIDTGLTIDNRTGVNMSNSDKVIRWVAVRGAINDWAIYVGFDTSSIDQVRKNGDKIGGISNIRRLVPCNDEALKQYRF